MSNRDFEEWYSGTYRETIHILPDGQYSSPRQQHSWDAWQAQQAKIDELQSRVDRYDKLISEFISDLEKTDSENYGNIHDYWRGFGSCANSAKKILQERIIDLKGNKDEN